MMKRTARTGNVLSAIIVLGSAIGYAENSTAACNATINGQPMPPRLCALATNIYGSVKPGHYWLDAQGNWGRLGSRYSQGNLYRDAQRDTQRDSGSSGSGMTCGQFGCVGGGYYYDPETGSSVGP